MRKKQKRVDNRRRGVVYYSSGRKRAGWRAGPRGVRTGISGAWNGTQKVDCWQSEAGRVWWVSVGEIEGSSAGRLSGSARGCETETGSWQKGWRMIYWKSGVKREEPKDSRKKPERLLSIQTSESKNRQKCKSIPKASADKRLRKTEKKRKLFPNVCEANK